MGAIKELHSSESDDYVNFVTISVWDEVFGFLLASVVFVATVKFIKLLKFNKRMSMLGDTILLAYKDLKTFVIMFMIYFFAFSMMAYVLFGADLADYGDFSGTIEALFSFALGAFDFQAFKGANKYLGPIFFFLFVAIINIGLMGMFFTIIDEAIGTVKANQENQSNEYEIVDFIWGKFSNMFVCGLGTGKKNKKQEEEEDEEDDDE